MGTSAHQSKLYTITRVCALEKNKTTNIYTDSRYTLRVAHNFGMLWKQHDFLTCSENKFLNGSNFQELPNVVLLPDTLAIKIPRHTKLDSLEAKENH